MIASGDIWIVGYSGKYSVMGQCCESLQTCLDQMRLGGAKTKPKKEKKQKGLINLNIGFGVMDEYVEEQVEKEKINNDLNY